MRIASTSVAGERPYGAPAADASVRRRTRSEYAGTAPSGGGARLGVGTGPPSQRPCAGTPRPPRPSGAAGAAGAEGAAPAPRRRPLGFPCAPLRPRGSDQAGPGRRRRPRTGRAAGGGGTRAGREAADAVGGAVHRGGPAVAFGDENDDERARAEPKARLHLSSRGARRRASPTASVRRRGPAPRPRAWPAA